MAFRKFVYADVLIFLFKTAIYKELSVLYFPDFFSNFQVLFTRIPLLINKICLKKPQKYLTFK